MGRKVTTQDTPSTAPLVVRGRRTKNKSTDLGGEAPPKKVGKREPQKQPTPQPTTGKEATSVDREQSVEEVVSLAIPAAIAGTIPAIPARVTTYMAVTLEMQMLCLPRVSSRK